MPLPTHEALMGVFDNHWSDELWTKIEAGRDTRGFNLSESVWNIANDAQNKAYVIIKEAEQKGITFGKVKKDLAALLSEKGKANMSYNVRRLWVDQVKTDRIIAQKSVWEDMGYIKNVILRRSDHAMPCETCDVEVGEGPDAERVVPLDYGNWPPFHPWCACDAQPEKPSAKSIAAFLKGDTGSPEVQTLMTSEGPPVMTEEEWTEHRTEAFAAMTPEERAYSLMTPEERDIYTIEAEKQYKIAASKIIDEQRQIDHVIAAQKWFDEHIDIVNNDATRRTMESNSIYMRDIKLWAAQNSRTMGRDISVEEYIKQAAANEQKILDNAEMKIGLSEDQLVGVLETGRYMSQFETHTSGGMLDEQYRAFAENVLFGLPSLVEDTPLENRPLYGFASDSSFTRVSYGDGLLNIVLNDNVRDRTTFTADDSLNLVRPGTYEGIPAGYGNGAPDSISHVVGQSLSAIRRDALKAVNIDDIRMGEYIEIQVHGGITLGDIKAIEICDPAIITKWGTIEAFMADTGNAGWRDLRNILRSASNKGIPVKMGQISESALAYARLIKGGG